MALTEVNFNVLVEEAAGDFDQLVKLTRDALRPVVDGDWAWTLPSGRQVRIDDLTIETIESIARRHGMDWLTLMRWPAQSPTMAWDVYIACCELGGEDPIDRPSNAGGFLRFTELVDRIPADVSTSYGEGGVPLGDEPSTD